MRTRTRIAVAGLLEATRFEVLPTARVVDEVSASLEAGATVTVTASPSKGLRPTLDCARELAGRGFDVVPHLAARMVSGPGDLAEIVAELREVGIAKVFVPAGDAEPGPGGYQGAFDLLEDLAALGSPFTEVGVTGYPESHPFIGDDITVQAMWDKRRHATYIVSNVCFDPLTLSRWIARIRARGIALPLLIGLAGPLERARLLKMAAGSGVAESARFLAGHADWLVRLGLPGGYSPQRLLDRASPALADPDSAVEGLHLFTFNQIRQTEQWRRALLDRLSAEVAR